MIETPAQIAERIVNEWLTGMLVADSPAAATLPRLRAAIEAELVKAADGVLASISVKNGKGTFGDPAVVVTSSLFPNWGHTINVVSKGHVLCDDGTVRKVLDKLFITADGAIVMPGRYLYYPGCGSGLALLATGAVPISVPSDEGPWRDADVSECYSTRDLALAAKGK